MDKYAVWVKAKPEFDRECIFVTAHLIKDVWDFNSWRIIKVDSEDGWYWALCDIDGEEWGPLEDLSAQLYYVLPNPDESPVDRGVEKAAEELTVSIQELAEQHCRDKDYSERQFEIGEESFIAGAKWAGNDAVEFAEWVSENAYRRFNSYKGKFWCDESEYEWMGEDDRLITTEQLYNLFKQKQ